MIEGRNVNVVVDVDGNYTVLINDIVFKGKRNVDWDEVKIYLEQYVGDYYKIEENAEKFTLVTSFLMSIRVQKVENY